MGLQSQTSAQEAWCFNKPFNKAKLVHKIWVKIKQTQHFESEILFVSNHKLQINKSSCHAILISLPAANEERSIFLGRAGARKKSSQSEPQAQYMAASRWVKLRRNPNHSVCGWEEGEAHAFPSPQAPHESNNAPLLRIRYQQIWLWIAAKGYSWRQQLQSC